MLLESPYALLGLLLIPLIILLRLWRLKPLTFIIPSLLLWQKIPVAKPGRVTSRRINFILALIIQVLAITALVLALSRPVLVQERSVPEEIIIILDNSVGMKAISSDGNTRWSKVIKHLKVLLDQLPAEQPIRLFLTTGSDAIIQDTAQAISHRLDSLRPQDIPLDWNEYLISISPELQRVDQNTMVYLYSDRMPPREIIGQLRINPHFILFGNPSRNIGITHLAVSQSRLGRDSAVAPQNVLVSIKNFSSRTITTALELHNGKGPLSKKNITLKAAETKPVIFKDINLEDSPFIKAKLVVPAQRDDFDIDNNAWLSRVEHHQIKIGWIGPPNNRIIKALQANPLVNIEYYDSQPASSDSDLYIYNHFSPLWKQGESYPGKYIVIDPASYFYPIQLKPKNPVQEACALDNSHSLFKSIPTIDFHLWQSSEIEIIPREKDSFRPLLSASNKVFMAEYLKAEQHLIVLGFDPTWYGTRGDADWSETISFPIFWANLVNYLGGESLPESDYRYYRTGEPLKLNLRHLLGAEELPAKLLIIQPDNATITTNNPTAEISFIPTRVGLYQVVADEKTVYLAVNLARIKASDTTGETRVPAVSDLVPETGKKSIDKTSSLLPYLVGIGLALLLIGWWIEKSNK